MLLIVDRESICTTTNNQFRKFQTRFMPTKQIDEIILNIKALENAELFFSYPSIDINYEKLI